MLRPLTARPVLWEKPWLNWMGRDYRMNKLGQDYRMNRMDGMNRTGQDYRMNRMGFAMAHTPRHCEDLCT